MSEWNEYAEEDPKDGQQCLVTIELFGIPFVDIATFSKDLSTVSRISFSDKVGVSGFYFTDASMGYLQCGNVIAWMPLPEPYQKDEDDDE